MAQQLRGAPGGGQLADSRCDARLEGFGGRGGPGTGAWVGAAQWATLRAARQQRSWVGGRVRGPRTPQRDSGGARGFSLVEVMIVVAVMAMLTGVVVGGTGMLSGARLRAASSLVVGAVRLAITHANSTGEAVRLVFDFEERRVGLEEASGRMLRNRDPQEGGGAEPATDFEREALDYTRRLLDGPKAPPARFRPIDVLSEEDGRPGRSLGRGIRFFQVQTEHDSEPRAEGRAYLYVWPGGATEQAAIQLGKTDEMSGVTVVVNALTGRARIQRGRLELEQAHQDGTLSEWEDDG